MKRTKNINHSSFRKSWSARHLTPVALAVTAVFMLAGCEKSDETVSLYQNADDCSAANPGKAAECTTAYTNAVKEAERTAPKYATREDCVAEFGEGQCQQTPAQAGVAETPEPDLCCTLLHEDRFIVVASPTLALSRPDDLAQVTLFHVANRHVPADSPSWENWRRRYGPPTLNIDAGLTFSDETHALQAAVAGQGAVIASELLARDLLQRGVLSAPFSSALPGASYYLVTTEAAAQRGDIIALREWLVGKMASGDSGQPAAG